MTHTLRPALARTLAVVRRIIGAPDYALYLEHMRVRHPDCAPLSVRDFERERLHDRYSRPGSRCC
ncbi:MAG: YbdD/YjiX family protein [Gemmatimonadetes bacterium]|nr:YbdD/YjiX family protein [Gemmatimonadota bacterium]